jgi:hypothetical protein
VGRFRLAALGALARKEAAALLTIRPSDRPWQLPFAAAVASGGPVALGAWLGLPGEGALGAVAGLSFLYLPGTRLSHRIPVNMASAFAMVVSYALGLASHLVPGAAIGLIALVAVGAALFCRFQTVAPPGPVFMVMAASIAAFAPVGPAGPMANLGYFAAGCIWACAIAVIYSIHILRRRSPLPVRAPSARDRQAAVVDAVIMGLFVGASLAVAARLELERAYWVPVSCLAIMQGVTMRASWSRNVHRIVGTAIGIALTWLLYPLISGVWAVAIAVTVLTFLIETAVVRHYALAAIFITPITIVLAESTSPGTASVDVLMQARLIDTVIGALIGLSGASLLHSRRVRRIVKARVMPGRASASAD